VPRRTADDRSKPVTLYGLRTDPSRWFRPGPVPRDALARIGRRARDLSSRRASRAAATAPVMFIGGLFGVMYAYQHLVHDYPAIAKVVAVGGVGFLLALLLRRTARDNALTAVLVPAFLAEHRCPACGDDLASRSPEPDGCTVCAKCGAAWRFERAPGASPR
jgi:hypothetical protein